MDIYKSNMNDRATPAVRDANIIRIEHRHESFFFLQCAFRVAPCITQIRMFDFAQFIYSDVMFNYIMRKRANSFAYQICQKYIFFNFVFLSYKW